MSNRGNNSKRANGYLELLFGEPGQFLLCEGRVLSFLLPQPGLMPGRRLVGGTVATVNGCFPTGTSLAVAMAQLGKVVPTVGKPQFSTEIFKVLSLVEALEKLLLDVSSIDPTNSIAFRELSRRSR